MEHQPGSSIPLKEVKDSGRTRKLCAGLTSAAPQEIGQPDQIRMMLELVEISFLYGDKVCRVRTLGVFRADRGFGVEWFLRGTEEEQVHDFAMADMSQVAYVGARP